MGTSEGSPLVFPTGDGRVVVFVIDQLSSDRCELELAHLGDDGRALTDRRCVVAR